MNDEAEPLYVEGETNEPLTRGEFNDAIGTVARSFDRVATKNDVANLATKDELDGVEQRLGGRIDSLESRFDGLETRFESLETRFDTFEAKIDAKFEHWTNAIVKHIDAVLADRLANVVTKDDVRQLDERVTRLERNTGFAPPGR